MPKPIPATKVPIKSGGFVYMPLIVVTAEYRGSALKFQALVDSGADDTIIPAAILEPLGIEWSSLPLAPQGEGGGAGGSLERRVCSDAVLKWGATNLMTGVTVAEPGKLIIPLLGRNDFFQVFVPTFHWYTSPPSFTLDPVPVASEPPVPATVPVSAKAKAKARPSKRKPSKRR